jgi:hypothetical protein
MNTYRDTPARCAREFCAFHAATLGGFCEECEAIAFAPANIDADLKGMWDEIILSDMLAMIGA